MNEYEKCKTVAELMRTTAECFELCRLCFPKWSVVHADCHDISRVSSAVLSTWTAMLTSSECKLLTRTEARGCYYSHVVVVTG